MFFVLIIIVFILFFYYFNKSKGVKEFILSEKEVCDCSEECFSDNFAFKENIKDDEIRFFMDVNSCYGGLFISNVKSDFVDEKRNLIFTLSSKNYFWSLCKCEGVKMITINRNKLFLDEEIQLGDVEVYYKEDLDNKLVFKSIYSLRNRP